MMHIMIIHIPEKDHIAVCRSVCGDIVRMMTVMAMMTVMFMFLMSAIRQYLLIFNSDLVLFIETAHRNTPSAPGGQFLFHSLCSFISRPNLQEFRVRENIQHFYRKLLMQRLIKRITLQVFFI